MKKLISLAIAAAMLTSLSACAGASDTSDTGSSAEASASQPAEATEVIVFAAASLEASLTEIAELYREVNPNVSLVFNFDSSGTLRDQIKEGAACDLFISAGQAQMNALDAEDQSGKNKDGQDLVYSDTRMDLLENKVVLAVPDENPSGLQSFQDLASEKYELLCIGNEDVPVGSYSLEILESLGINIEQLEADAKVTYATNVTEVATQVKESIVDCGIIYATDAFTHKLTVVDQATPEMCSQVIYPAAVMKSSSTETTKELAQEFLEYLHTDDGAVAVLENVGFQVLGR